MMKNMKIAYMILFFSLAYINVGYGQSHIHLFDIVEETVPKNKNGEYHGKGKIIWASGDVYKGSFKKGHYHGYAVMKWISGELYEGKWKNDVKHGYGELTWKDGSKYAGRWKKDKMHGIGIMYDSENGQQKGRWRNGVLVKEL